MSNLNFIIVALLFNVCCRYEVKMAQSNEISLPSLDEISAPLPSS
jgi:hypothetical protein